MGVEGSVIFEHFEGLNMYLFIIILWDHQVCVTSVLLKLSHWPKTLNFFCPLWPVYIKSWGMSWCALLPFSHLIFFFTLYFTDFPGMPFLISQ